jgi:hypothetical protein
MLHFLEAIRIFYKRHYLSTCRGNGLGVEARVVFDSLFLPALACGIERFWSGINKPRRGPICPFGALSCLSANVLDTNGDQILAVH